MLAFRVLLDMSQNIFPFLVSTIKVSSDVWLLIRETWVSGLMDHESWWIGTERNKFKMAVQNVDIPKKFFSVYPKSNKLFFNFSSFSNFSSRSSPVA